MSKTLTITSKSLLRALIFFGSTTFILCYVITGLAGGIYWPYIYLSSALNYPPATTVGAFALSISCAIFPFVSLIRYNQIAGKSEEKNFVRANEVSFVCSVVGMVGAHGVASCPTSVNLVFHLFSAFLFFSSGGLYACLQVYLDKKTKADTMASKIRLVNMFVGIGTLFSMGICGLAILIKTGFGQTAEFETEPTLMGTNAIFELLFAATLMIVYSTFWSEMEGFEIIISTGRRSGEVMLLSEVDVVAPNVM